MWDKVFVESQFALLYKPARQPWLSLFTGQWRCLRETEWATRGGNIYGLTILFAGNTSNTSPISLNFLQYLRNLNPAHLVTVMSLLTITEMGWATENWFTHTGGYNKRTMQNYCLCKFISLFGKEEGDAKYLCAWDQNVLCSAHNKTSFCSVLCYNWMATHAEW